MIFNEDMYERAVIQLFHDVLGYQHIYAPDLGERDYQDPFLLDELNASLERINPNVPVDMLNEVVKALRDIEGATMEQRNKIFMHYLQNGVAAKRTHQGEEVTHLVHLVDYLTPANNSFVIANQWTIVENDTKRPDLIVFLNGLPVVIIELKSPVREEANASKGYKQLRNYLQDIPSLFTYNAFLAMSDMTVSKAGTITASEDRFMEWKTKDGDYENNAVASFDTFFEGMFQKERLLNIIKNFICFSVDVKILAGYHQYFAVLKAVAVAEYASGNGTGKGGVVWHTQGSGKSLSMVFYAKLVKAALGNSPTIVVLTDRNDLDEQLFSQFNACREFLREDPVQASSRTHLKELLSGRLVGGIIFSTMQKFEELAEPLSTRRNIVVMTDEAHRSQYGLDATVDKEGNIKIGAARIIRNNLPHATYIGFTGTPISSKDKSTVEVFGDYIDIYDMTRAVDDGATRPVYYESRVLHLKLSDSVLSQIDAEYEKLADDAEEHAIQKSKAQLSRLDSILGAPQTIDTLVDDILKHYEDNRAHELTGKAMIVAYSRPIAMEIYHRILKQRPQWKELVKVIMTSSNQDPEEWKQIVGSKTAQKEKAKQFKKDTSQMKIAIVVDMWLTGFDVPSLATMYVYKPMKSHNLMQAIARVNRVYDGKEGGLVVDYVGIASALKEAMQEYTSRDQANYGNPNIADVALPKFNEKLEVCRDFFHGFDYTDFLDKNAEPYTRAKLIQAGASYLIDFSDESKKESFIKEVRLLQNALQLSRSLVDEKARFEAGYFEVVKTVLTRVQNTDKPLSLNEINAQINELLKASIKSEGVINLFSNVDSGISLFDPKFLQEIANMKEKNLAIEMLKRLIKEQVASYRRTNLVKSEKFSDMLTRAMNAYINSNITNDEVIAELMSMAKEINEANHAENELGLTPEEVAFYDALSKPEAINDFYDNEALINLTKELTESLRKSCTIDWQKKASARADMKRKVKRLLKRYGYPPEGQEYALEAVIRQCEQWADNI